MINLTDTPDSEDFLSKYPDANEILKNTNITAKEVNTKDPKSGSESIIKFIGDVRNDGVSGGFDNLDFPHCREMVNVRMFSSHNAHQIIYL